MLSIVFVTLFWGFSNGNRPEFADSIDYGFDSRGGRLVASNPGFFNGPSKLESSAGDFRLYSSFDGRNVDQENAGGDSEEHYFQGSAGESESDASFTSESENIHDQLLTGREDQPPPRSRPVSLAGGYESQSFRAVSSLAAPPSLNPVTYGTRPSESTGSVITCPQLDATYLVADERQCDRYHSCNKGIPETFLCEDGFVFSIPISRCVPDSPGLCENRPLRQRPKGTPPCFRQNGIFPSNRSCDEFITCRNDEVSIEKCPEGLVFHPTRQQCTWPDDARREGCLPEQFLKFRCPTRDHSFTSFMKFGDHERYRDPNDCRYFFICLRTGQPRRAGCGRGQVFDSSSGLCRPAKDVPGCENYYKNVDLSADEDSQLNGYFDARANRGQRAKRWIEPEPEE